MEVRFDAIDARFDAMDARLDANDGRLNTIDARLDRLRVEMNERFQSVNDRLDTNDKRLARLSDELEQFRAELVIVKHRVEQLDGRLASIDTGLHHLNMRVDGLGDDMRQRFRAVTERLANVA
jgi:chromosome segregation ATPase